MGLPYSRILIDSVASVSYSSAVTPFGWSSFSPMLLVSKLCFAPCRLRFQTGETRGEAILQTMKEIDVEELREWISYNPDTGILTWNKCRAKWVEPNRECGSLQKLGYRVVGFKGRTYPAHRIAFALYHGRWPTCELDHVNRVRDDNRITNLREATRAENKCNASQRGDNSSGVVGISRCRDQQKWRAQVQVGGCTHSKRFTSIEEAAEWVKKKRAELHGEFAAQH